MIPFTGGTISEFHLYIIFFSHSTYRTFMDSSFSKRRTEGLEKSPPLIRRGGIQNIFAEEQEII
jgi:hypothetical protein